METGLDTGSSIFQVLAKRPYFNSTIFMDLLYSRVTIRAI